MRKKAGTRQDAKSLSSIYSHDLRAVGGLEDQKVEEGTIKLKGRMEKCHGRAGRWGPDQVPAGVGSLGASGWLGSATPPARAAGIRSRRGAPRPPPQRQESGLARTHGSPSPQILPGRSWVPREAGGTGRGQSLSQRPAALCSSRRLASSSPPGLPPGPGRGARARTAAN